MHSIMERKEDEGSTAIRASTQVPNVWSTNDKRNYICEKCGKNYKWKGSLRNHVRLECGKEPQFYCHLCPHKTYQKGNLIRHVALFHKLR